MKSKRSFLGALLLLASLGANADVIDAYDMGWYDNSGLHVPEELNYAVGGEIPFTTATRNFFVFDLGAGVDVVSATLRVFLAPSDITPFSGGYFIFNDEFETWSLFDISVSMATLLDGSAGIGAYQDLGSGLAYGQVDVTAAMQDSYVEVALNADAIASINQSTGLWGVGGALTTNVNGSAIVFAFSHLAPAAELAVVRSTVPVLGTLPLLVFSLMVLGQLYKR